MKDTSRKISISPSLICCDLCNLEQEVARLERIGVDSLHIDIIDSHFSPSLPMGIDTIRQLRKKTDLDFDIHLMVENNEFFINEMIDIGVQRICFHCESELHIDRMLNIIKSNNVEAGIALNPTTPFDNLEYCLEYIDFVLLMLINPGFASQKTESQISYALQKVAKCKKYLIDEGRSEVAIMVDGRVSFDTMNSLIYAGADILVAGSTSLFDVSGTLDENFDKIKKSIEYTSPKEPL